MAAAARTRCSGSGSCDGSMGVRMSGVERGRGDETPLAVRAAEGVDQFSALALEMAMSLRASPEV